MSQELGDAQVVEGNPPGLVYEAVLPEEPFSEISVEGNVKGSIVATSAPDGVGVEYKVRFSNLPQDGGRFCKRATTLHFFLVPPCTLSKRETSGAGARESLLA